MKTPSARVTRRRHLAGDFGNSTFLQCRAPAPFSTELAAVYCRPAHSPVGFCRDWDGRFKSEGGSPRFCKALRPGRNFALRLGSVVVLARLLDPKDFGLVAMVAVVTGIYGLFTTAGLSLATVQKATITDEQISTLFWINMLIGVILAVLCVATAPVLVAFYHEPRLFWVTVAMAAGFLFNAAGVQHSALLQRQLRYVALTVIETLSQLVSVVVGIGMAIAGFGYWALVAVTIVSPAISTVCMWLTTAWIPGMPRRKVGIGSMLRFGGTVTLNGLVVYVAYNLEKVLLGRFWGPDALGIYGRAYQLINIPTDNLNSAIGGVAFSALSRLQDDPVRLEELLSEGLLSGHLNDPPYYHFLCLVCR